MSLRWTTTPEPYPWWFDFGAGQIVRRSDGQRFAPGEVPELVSSARERRAVDVGAVDAWVLAAPERDH